MEVEDDSINGRADRALRPRRGRSRGRLTFRYRIKRRTPLTPLIDMLFVRRMMISSLEKTLGNFGACWRSHAVGRRVALRRCSCSRPPSSAPARWAGRSRRRSPTPGSRSCSRTSSTRFVDQGLEKARSLWQARRRPGQARAGRARAQARADHRHHRLRRVRRRRLRDRGGSRADGRQADRVRRARRRSPRATRSWRRTPRRCRSPRWARRPAGPTRWSAFTSSTRPR